RSAAATAPSKTNDFMIQVSSTLPFEANGPVASLFRPGTSLKVTACRFAGSIAPIHGWLREAWMKSGSRGTLIAAALAAVLAAGGPAAAAQCGDGGGGFENWKAEFIREAGMRGISPVALDALARTTYTRKTIAADRGQKSFKLSLESFMKRRGADAIISRGKGMKKRYASLFASIEQRF